MKDSLFAVGLNELFGGARHQPIPPTTDIQLSLSSRPFNLLADSQCYPTLSRGDATSYDEVPKQQDVARNYRKHKPKD